MDEQRLQEARQQYRLSKVSAKYLTGVQASSQRYNFTPFDPCFSISPPYNLCVVGNLIADIKDSPEPFLVQGRCKVVVVGLYPRHRDKDALRHSGL